MNKNLRVVEKETANKKWLGVLLVWAREGPGVVGARLGGVWARAEGVIGVGFGWDEGYRLERREKWVLIWVLVKAVNPSLFICKLH